MTTKKLHADAMTGRSSLEQADSKFLLPFPAHWSQPRSPPACNISTSIASFAQSLACPNIAELCNTLLFVCTMSTFLGLSCLSHYGARYGKRLYISSSIAESAVNPVVSHRMANKQRMRWTDEGAHCMAQVRVAVLNGELSIKGLE